MGNVNQSRRRRVGGGLGQVLALGLAVWIVTQPAAAEDGGKQLAAEGGIGIAAALTTMVYGPLKVVYSLVGSMAAGFAWAFSGGDSEVARTVVTRAVAGTYVLTPAMLKGQEEIEFVGRSPRYRESADPPAVASGPVDNDETSADW